MGDDRRSIPGPVAQVAFIALAAWFVWLNIHLAERNAFYRECEKARTFTECFEEWNGP